jgi:hypothetical protein
MTTDEKYAASKLERQKYIDRILSSKSQKKVVVAGPGTGKTFLFKQIVAGKPESLTLSFVNSLVEDLSLELCGLSEVRTLHSFARGALSSALKKDIKLFPKLPYVIREDARVLIGADVDFDSIFHDRDDKNEHLPFYRQRRVYYDHYGHTDVIYSAVRYFESKEKAVPTYPQVVVDEFQDFNLLEVSLINLLAEGSPILLAGDDDQALYHFKKATPQHLRDCHSEGSAYEAFTLPFCSRCTRPIVVAANNVIDAAQKNGNLKGRVNKGFHYFDDRGKDEESDRYPHIIYKRVHDKQVPWAIETEIRRMAEDIRSRFSILVISPLGRHPGAIVSSLRAKGFEAVEHSRRDKPEPSLLDGLKILLDDEGNNLGWRMWRGPLAGMTHSARY